MKGQFLTNIIWLGNNLIYNLKTKGNQLLKQKNPRNLNNQKIYTKKIFII